MEDSNRSAVRRAPTLRAINVNLSDNRDNVTTPGYVMIDAGLSSFRTRSTTLPVSAAQTVTITGSYNGVVKSCVVNIKPIVPPTSLTFSGDPYGGYSTTATLHLAGNTLRAETFKITDNSDSASAGSQVTIPAGRSTINFQVTTLAVPFDRTAIFTATSTLDPAAKVSGSFTIKRMPVLSTLNLSATSVTGGQSLTGTITIDRPAPPSGLVTDASVNGPGVTVPAHVTVPSGQTTVTFTITTAPATVQLSRIISVTYGGITRTKGLTIKKT